MSEKTSGIYRLVTIPAVYKLIQDSLGGYEKCRDAFFKGLAGKRVLEVGCGPGTWYKYIDHCSEYVGIDWNEQHIDFANQAYASKTVRFIAGDVSSEIGLEAESFDVVLAIGILHHLNDEQAFRLLVSASKMLVEEGSFISLDPVYHEGQGRFSKWMKDRDSGQNIRWPDEYSALARPHFREVKTDLRTDLLRIPYSHFMMNCTGKLIADPS